MANTVVARFAVVLFIIAASFETALSIKCYSCSSTSLKECEKNETIQTCDGQLDACGQFKLETELFSSYTKLCTVAKADFCKAVNLTIPFNCTASTPCIEDYCNGVAPTTLAPPVIESTTALSGTEEMTTKKHTSSDASAVICNKTFQLLVACVVAVLSRL